MKESELTTQVKNDLYVYCQSKGIGAYWQKLDDFPANSIAVALRNMLCPRCQPMVNKTGLGRFQSRKRPFDVVAVIDGIPVAIEFKMHSAETAFPIDKIHDYQEAGLRDFATAGGVGLVIIGNVFEPKNEEHWDSPWLYRGTVYRLLVLPVAQWRHLRMDVGAQRKSIPLDLLAQTALKLGRVSLAEGRGWDVEGLVHLVRTWQGLKLNQEGVVV